MTLLLDIGGEGVIACGNLAVLRSSKRLSSSDRLLEMGERLGVGGLAAPSNRPRLRGDDGDAVRFVVVVVTSRTMYWFW